MWRVTRAVDDLVVSAANDVAHKADAVSTNPLTAVQPDPEIDGS